VLANLSHSGNTDRERTLCNCFQNIFDPQLVECAHVKPMVEKAGHFVYVRMYLLVLKLENQAWRCPRNCPRLTGCDI
jgi:hypothetical protein